jgi:hypothetical protein
MLMYWFQSRVRFNQVVCTCRTHDLHHQLHEQASPTSAQPPGSKVNDPIGIEHKGHTPSSLKKSSEEVASGLPSPTGESTFCLELARYTPWAVQAFTRLATYRRLDVWNCISLVSNSGAFAWSGDCTGLNPLDGCSHDRSSSTRKQRSNLIP